MLFSPGQIRCHCVKGRTGKFDSAGIAGNKLYAICQSGSFSIFAAGGNSCIRKVYAHCRAGALTQKAFNQKRSAAAHNIEISISPLWTGQLNHARSDSGIETAPIVDFPPVSRSQRTVSDPAQHLPASPARSEGDNTVSVFRIKGQAKVIFNPFGNAAHGWRSRTGCIEPEAGCSTGAPNALCFLYQFNQSRRMFRTQQCPRPGYGKVFS